MKECSYEALSFGCEHPQDFCKIVCQKHEGNSKLLLAYRVLAELYTAVITVWFICVTILTPEQKFYISYLMWVQVVWSTSTEFALMTSIRAATKSDSEDSSTTLTWYTKVYWCFFSATLPSVVVSFIVFWTEMPHENVNLLYIFLGNVTPLLTMIEFAIIAFPLRVLHFFYFLLVSLVYIIISVVYQKLGGRGMNNNASMYKDLDWRDPKHAVLTCFIALLVGEAAYFIFWGLNKLKLSKWCCGKEPS